MQNPDGTYDTIFIVFSMSEAARVRAAPYYLALMTRAYALGAHAIISDMVSDMSI